MPPVPSELPPGVSGLDPWITGDDDEIDPDWESCSWCLEMVPDETLTEMDDGARICDNCEKTETERR